MNFQTKIRIDLAVQSFAYVASQLASSPSAQFEHIVNEAEKHRHALQVMQRDVFEVTRQKLHDQVMSEKAFHRNRKAAATAIEQAQDAITRIVAQYSPHRMAA
jgi:hypothetical protein